MKILNNVFWGLILAFCLSTLNTQASSLTCTPTTTKVCLIVDGDEDSLEMTQIVNGIIETTEFNQITCGTGRCRELKIKLENKSLEIITGTENRILMGAEAGEFANFIVSLDSLAGDNFSAPSYEFSIGEGEDDEDSLLAEGAVLGIASRTSRSNNPKRKYAFIKEAFQAQFQRYRNFHHYNFQAKSNKPKLTELRITLINSVDLKFEIKNPASIASESSSEISNTDPNSGRFELEIDGRSFVLEVNNAETLTEMRSILSNPSIEKNKIAGFLTLNSQDYNPGWSFHLDPATIELFRLGDPGFDITCDAGPDLIERSLDDIGTVNFLFDSFWCPRSAKLVREL